MGEVGESFSHLSESQGVVEGCDRYVAAVDNLGPFSVRVDARSWVVSSKAGLTC